jgi:hypothetical protein
VIRCPLSAADLRLAADMGLARNGIKERNGVATRRYDDLSSDSAVHIVGAMGEIAVARLFGVEPDTSVHLGGDPGYDLVCRGSTWDVKTRRGINRDLLIYPDMSDFRADYCALCWLVKPGVIWIVGYVRRETYRELARLTANGERLYMRWQDLAQVYPKEHESGLLAVG